MAGEADAALAPRLVHLASPSRARARAAGWISGVDPHPSGAHFLEPTLTQTVFGCRYAFDAASIWGNSGADDMG